MSDMILISKVGLYETVRCAICQNPNQTERGCDGSCQYDKELHAKIVEAVIGIAEQRPHGKWIIIDDCEHFIAKCSVCGRIIDSRMVKDYPFCRCGADMRKEGEAE